MPRFSEVEHQRFGANVDAFLLRRTAQIRRELTFGVAVVVSAPRFSPYLFLRLFAAIPLGRVAVLEKGHAHDLKIENRAPIFHVPEIVIDPLSQIGIAA
jgi:hypothetical protein